MSQWIADHGLTSGTDDSPTYAKAQAEINANYPVVLLNSLTSAGHYITCIGYFQNQYTLIFNDPYGNKNISYPGTPGAGAYYDWPGYNNGYQNLNDAWRYIYARGTVAANTNWGSYWDLNGATAGAGDRAQRDLGLDLDQLEQQRQWHGRHGALGRTKRHSSSRVGFHGVLHDQCQRHPGGGQSVSFKEAA